MRQLCAQELVKYKELMDVFSEMRDEKEIPPNWTGLFTPPCSQEGLKDCLQQSKGKQLNPRLVEGPHIYCSS